MTTRDLANLLPRYGYQVSVWRSATMGDIWRLGPPSMSGPQIPRYLASVIGDADKSLVMWRKKYSIYRIHRIKKGLKNHVNKTV